MNNFLNKILKPKRLTSGLFILVISVLGYTILYQSKAATPNPPTIYINPESTTLAPNTEFTVQIRENSGTTEVSGVQAAITYPTNLLDFVGQPNDDGSLFTIAAESSVNNGKIIIARGSNPGSGFPVGDQLVTKLTFKTKAGSGAGSIAFIANETSLIGTGGPSNIVSGAGRLQGSSIEVDATAPTVTVSGITNNQSVSSLATLPVNISTSDNKGIAGVDVYVDGALKESISGTTNSYIYQWKINGLSLGNHTFQAKAKDTYGNTGQSSVVTVQVADKTPPTVTINSPSPSSTLSGNINITASASDTGGTNVTKVEFYVNSNLLTTDTTSPYQAVWPTTNGSYPDGAYQLTAKAYDGATPANATTSNPLSVTVENSDKTPPTTPTQFKGTATSSTSINLSWGASTDNIGVTGYKITRNGLSLPMTTNLTLDDTGLSPGTTYNYTIVATDASGNQSQTANATVSTPNKKIGDANNDNLVNLDDLAILLAKWRTTASNCDFDNSGVVDIVDLAMLLTNYGK